MGESFFKRERKTFLPGSKFKIVSQLLLTRLRQVMELQTQSENFSKKKLTNMQDYGLKKGVLIDWFIQHVISLKLISPKDVEKETILVPKVIRKLIKQGQ